MFSSENAAAANLFTGAVAMSPDSGLDLRSIMYRMTDLPVPYHFALGTIIMGYFAGGWNERME